MPFWSTNFGEDTTLKDPKRKFRFTVEFQGIQSAQGGALLWYAKTVSKPSFQIAATEHKYLNHTFYYPGSVSWQDVTVALVDPVDPDMAATLSDIIVQSGYSPPTDANSLVTMSKAKAAAALGTVIITQIDSEGKPLETWTLWNSFIGTSFKLWLCFNHLKLGISCGRSAIPTSSSFIYNIILNYSFCRNSCLQLFFRCYFVKRLPYDNCSSKSLSNSPLSTAFLIL